MIRKIEFELSEWKYEYSKDIAFYANNIKVAKNLRNVFPYPYTLSDAESYVKDCINNCEQRQICRAIIVNGQAVGSIGVFLKDDVYSKSAELGYWLGEPFWGKGIMTNAVKMICDEAFRKFDIVRIFAEPFSFNIGSQKVLEKSGFKLEGILKKSVYKNQEFYDTFVYGLVK